MVVTDAATTSARHAAPELPPEPCFRRPLPHRLAYAAADQDAALCRWLTARIQRRPGDLLAHVQRLYALLAQGDGAALFGALADLFIVLGARGQALKLRLLDDASPYLSDAQLGFLFDHLDYGLDATTPLPWPDKACLSAGLQGARRLVTRRTPPRPQTELPPLLLARELLDGGDLAGALRVLEDALLSRPAAVELQRELLEIYRHSRDAASLLHLEARLAAAGGVPIPEWHSVRESLVAANRENDHA
ncbi:MAG TPA: hypothetical protein VNN09_10835 [Candidatus Competibacteraceae bacterium]|nr:hypothetical protein [Candidatus Competibacteraceae bacterium]